MTGLFPAAEKRVLGERGKRYKRIRDSVPWLAVHGRRETVGKLQFVFVHGLSGWGSYDERYRRMSYWGMRGGDLMAALRGEGYDCYAASVAPTGSAWDRACELYAQIAGTRTDYGAAHSGRFRHERYGPDFTARPRSPHRTVPAFRAGKDFHTGIVRQGSRGPCLFPHTESLSGSRQSCEKPDAFSQAVFQRDLSIRGQDGIMEPTGPGKGCGHETIFAAAWGNGFFADPCLRRM